MPLGERFLFDLSFDDADLAHSEQEIEASGSQEAAGLIDIEADIPSFSEEQVDEARKLGFDEGLQAGLEKAKAENETSLGETLTNIHSLLEILLKNQNIDSTNTYSDAVKIALAVTKKCFPHQNIKHGFNEIEFMVREVLKETFDEPRVLIYINPKITEFMTDQIKAMTKEMNFDGQVVVLEDKEIMLGDCKVNWSNGGAERNIESTMSKIDQIVESNLDNLYKSHPVVSENDDNTSDHMALSEIIKPHRAASEVPTAQTESHIADDPLTETSHAPEITSSASNTSINNINNTNHSPSDIAGQSTIVDRPADSAMESDTIAQINSIESEEARVSRSEEKDGSISGSQLSQKQTTTDIQNKEVKMEVPATDEETHASSNHDTPPKTEPFK